MNVSEESKNTPARIKIKSCSVEEKGTKNDENACKDVIQEH